MPKMGNNYYSLLKNDQFFVNHVFLEVYHRPCTKGLQVKSLTLSPMLHNIFFRKQALFSFNGSIITVLSVQEVRHKQSCPLEIDIYAKLSVSFNKTK